MKQIVVVAAGTGGHVIPALTFAKRWSKENNGSFIFISGRKKVDEIVLHSFGITSYIQYHLRNLPGKQLWLYPLFIFQFFLTFFKSFWFFKKQKPEFVYSTGGLLAVPICLAAYWCSIPIILHELNAKPGKAILFLSSYASTIFITLAETKLCFKSIKAKIEVIPYPVRFTHEDSKIQKTEALLVIQQRTNISFDSSKKTLLVIGGSQGSQFLNERIQDWIETLTSEQKAKLQILHQAGTNNVSTIKKWYEHQTIVAYVFGFESTMQYFYAAADFAVGRAGAGTLFELLFFKKRSLLVPLEKQADDHQTPNAQALVNQYPHLFNRITQKTFKNHPELLTNYLFR